jgi:hypothetical protein
MSGGTLTLAGTLTIENKNLNEIQMVLKPFLPLKTKWLKK